MQNDYNKEADTILHSKIFEALGRIEAQTVKTNGRVSKLEMWRWSIGGALAVVMFIFPFTLYFIANTVSKLQEDVKNNTDVVSQLHYLAK